MKETETVETRWSFKASSHDQGVNISNDLKHSKHCKLVCRKDVTLTGFSARNFDRKTPKVVLTLYKHMVGPYLEYEFQFLSPNHKKHIELLERVQRQAAKMILSLKQQAYEESLKWLNLFTQGKRRLRGNLLKVLKHLNKFSSADHTSIS